MRKNKEEYIFYNKNGNVFIGLATIMVFLLIIMSIIFLNVSNDSNQINNDAIDSNSFNYMIQDYNRNIPVLGKDIMGKIANDTIHNYVPCSDSPNTIKKRLQEKLDEKNEEIGNNNNIMMESEVLSVYNGNNPYHVNIKTHIHGKKGNLEYDEVIESVVKIEGLKDPLPFLMCKNKPNLSENGTKIIYHDSLEAYFIENNLLNPYAYNNASSPLIIKKCPYDPYEHHGDGHTLKNCIDNGYYHESADGACYLCRLEGKGVCNHYGLETFIVPNKVNELNFRSISSSDHVIFNDHYPGENLGFYKNGSIYEILFLDDSHRAKYGVEHLSYI
ncbi:hypothetical protein [Methanobrevibacter cuticularis]|nr:hypothetical protein [Methanobrevibacter cuticularis]